MAVQTVMKEDGLLEDGEDKLLVVVASSKLELEWETAMVVVVVLD